MLTNKLTKTLSGLALALVISNVANAATVRYNYSHSDGTNTLFADFYIDNTKADNNLISGTFSVNSNKFAANALNSRGLVDMSTYGSQFSGYSLGLKSDYANTIYGDGWHELIGANYTNLDGADLYVSKYSQLLISSPRFTIGGAGTLTVVPATSVSAVPVPAAAWLFGSGLLGLVGLRRRKQAV